jgi:hypothetical protein
MFLWRHLKNIMSNSEGSGAAELRNGVKYVASFIVTSLEALKACGNI